MSSSDMIKNVEVGKSKIDVLDRIYNILEDAVYYRLDEMEDNVIFNRKVTMRLLKNQKYYLCMTLDL
jgi:hypothetical protein